MSQWWTKTVLVYYDNMNNINIVDYHKNIAFPLWRGFYPIVITLN